MNHAPTQFRLELNIAAEQMISAFQLHNEAICEQTAAGIKKAIDEFDFEAEVAQQAKALIKNIVSDFMWKGEMKKLVEKKVGTIVQELVDREMKAWEANNNKQ